jgi:hypothetical protein
MDGIGFHLCFFCPNGLFDLVWCRNGERVTAAAAIVKDITKSRVKLALSSANPLHTLYYVLSQVLGC